MSSTEETHGDAHAHGDDAHGHGDDHSGHESATTFIKEESLQDKGLQLAACVVACGLLFMMYIWWTAPISYVPEEEHKGIQTPADAKGSEPGTRNNQPGPASVPAPAPGTAK
ncbi:MAG TPA: hypothetical protein V6C81_28000 [Planktothrix sp.]|jgi:hypothetical protein